MIVKLRKSRKQPVLNSCYISHFTPETMETLKTMRPFATYHKDTREYEVPPKLMDTLTEPVELYSDETQEPPVFTRQTSSPYGYQQDAVNFAMQVPNILLNFPQGMGKSRTTMMILDALHVRRTLIICGQGNLQEEWVKDATKHGYANRMHFGIAGDDTGSGNAKKVKWLRARGDVGVDLINIEALRSDDIIAAINERGYDCIVVDEVQSAKGWKSKQTEGLHSVMRGPHQTRIALSGTPVLNNPLEFFSMLKFFNQLDDTVRTTFEKYYGEWGFDYWGHYVCKGYRNLDDLAALMKPVVCYVDKSELNLPPKTRKRVQVPFGEGLEEFLMLASVYKMSTSRMKKHGYQTKPEVRSKMINLTATCPGKKAFVLDKARQEKCLVFSQYTTVLDEYDEYLTAKGIPHLYYHGGLSMQQRLDVLNRWREGGYQVLLLSIMAARYGLNLTEATTAIFLDIPPSLAILEQAEDRTYRIGQTRPTTSYLLSSTVIDEDALSNIATKQRELERLTKLWQAPNE